MQVFWLGLLHSVISYRHNRDQGKSYIKHFIKFCQFYSAVNKPPTKFMHLTGEIERRCIAVSDKVDIQHVNLIMRQLFYAKLDKLQLNPVKSKKSNPLKTRTITHTHTHKLHDWKERRYQEVFRAHPAAVLQHGGRQYAAGHLGHLIPHAELKLLHKWVSLVVCTAYLWQSEREKIGTYFNFKLIKRKKKKRASELSARPRECDVTLTSRLISSCRSGADRAVALIMVEVWLSVSFLMQRCPATILHTCMKTAG